MVHDPIISPLSDKPNGQQVLNAPPRREAPWDRPIDQRHGAKSHAWIWITLLILIAGVVGYFVYTRLTQTDPKAAGRDAAGRAVPVVAVPARQGDMNIYLNGLGSVTALNTVTVRARVDGQLMEVNFVEGEVVKEGKPLFEIDPRPYKVQLAQAEGQMAKDQAQLKNAQADLKRYQIAREAVSQQQLDTAAANVANFEGAVKVDQGQIDSAKLQIFYCTITAPITGRIGLRMVDRGNMIHASDANGLAVITQLQPVALLFSLPEDAIPSVVKKMNAGVKLDVEAYDRDFKVKLATGTLLAIDSQIDSNSGTVRFKAIFPNEDNSLFPNQFINARLLIETIKDAVLVPNAAVQRSPQSAFVYVVKRDDKGDSTVDMRNIEVGPTEGDDTVIQGGLSPAEMVVTDGIDKLQQGAKVTLGRPAATRPTTGGGGGAGRGPATQHSPATQHTSGNGGGSRGAGNRRAAEQ
jgi:multidrug efflux system membrane fusion protein